MKRVLLTICIIVGATLSSMAQEFNPVKVGFGFGYASPGGEGAKGGVIVYLEPAYRINDAIAIGLRFEAAAMARSVVLSGGGTTLVGETEVQGNASYSLNGQYYFMGGSFRPFAGAGFGLFTLASQTASVSGTGGSVTATASNNKFGFYPRVGFDMGHLTLQVEYNIIPANEAEVSVTVGTVTETLSSKSTNSYLGVKLGFFVGGGKK